MLSLYQITKQFPHHPHPTLNQLCLDVEPGHSVSIQGPSGSGKSTLLAIIAGFERADSGTLHLDERDLGSLTETKADAFRRQHLGVIFQAYNLLDCFNVWDNVAFPARLKGNYLRQRIDALLEQLGIAHHRNSPVSALSGGEQQRVAIARALSHQPSLVLADEPTGNLDEDTGESVADTLFQVCKENHTTLVVVTHNRRIALRADHTLNLHHGKLVHA